MDATERYEAGKAAAAGWCRGALHSTGPLLQDLKSNHRQIRRRIQLKASIVLESGDPDRWLLDNQYLIELAVQSARDGLRGAAKLPMLGTDEEQYRLIVLAGVLTTQPESFTPEEIVAFLRGIQENTPLQERELRTLFFALQYVAIQQLASALPQPKEDRERSFSNLFARLRQWNDMDFQIVTEQASMVHTAFLGDPTGDYAKMPPNDRARYRQRLERMAGQEKTEEAELAQKLVDQAGNAHIGFLLFGQDSAPLRVMQNVYFPALTLVSLLLSLWLGFFVGQGWSFVLFWLPVFGMLKGLTDTILLRVVPQRPVFRLSLDNGLPPEQRTLLVKTVILTGEDSLEEVRRLECIYLANRDCGREFSLGLLADLPERDAPITQEDRDLICRLESALNQLNRRYDGQFFLFFRGPVYQSSQGTFAGWERKRGALLELARMLRARHSRIEVYSGDQSRLQAVRYLVTLDSDTNPGVGGVRPLVGAMAHPMNRPKLDRTRGVVTKGYAIIQPQIRTALSAARATPFARLFAGGAGTDPYRGTGSELCHDLFDEASFCGKGILDIDCFLACMDGRIPDQRVLSHDILEGAFLRTGFLGQVSFGDGFPGTVGGFYKRQHRWVRGDWQNFPWVLGKIPTASGREPNPLSTISRWKLVDNLRRSLTPIAQMICLVLGVLAGGKLNWLVWIGLGSLVLEPLLSMIGSLAGGGLNRRFHARTGAGVGYTFRQIVVKLVLLPLEAWTNASAAVQAMWRCLISKKNLLQWTTFAQQNGQRGARLRTGLPMLISGAMLGVLALLTWQPWGLLLAVIWLAAPMAVLDLDRPSAKPELHPRERAFLLHEAEQIWGFFADFMTPERNFLPPDNVQFRPYQGPAERTSPTNIGFAALSCLTAMDLDLESRDHALNRIAGLLDTLEKLEKWRGNLYNWYHTITLAPMAPKVVSSVDSGNLCGCLLALSTGLSQRGRDDLARRALQLARETDLAALYDRKKHLFYISYEPETDTWSEAHYDLMASEARLLSYVALGLGQVEHRHWAALSRVQAAAHGYQGMVSWFGTMFEYFMPHLLLPLPENSFLYESLAFCACEQVRFGRKKGIPWGISESALPKLDRNGCYSYRANGLSSVALCHMPEREPVVAPYATYLTLSMLPHRAVDNLLRLRENGLEGKYGLYEAAEYGREGILAARSWMSHHMGMSLVAIDNALLDQIQIKRLMALPDMQAFRTLLEEEIPRGTKPLGFRSGRPVRERVTRVPAGWQVEGSGVSEELPVCALLHGQNLSAVVTNSGYCWLSGDGESLTPRRTPPALYLNRNGTLLQLFPCVPGANVSWRLGERRGEYHLKLHGLEARLTIALESVGVLTWTVELTGQVGQALLLVTLCPQLAGERDFLAHPTFSLLRIDTEQTAGAVTFHRRGGVGQHPDLRCRWAGQGVEVCTGPRASERLYRFGLPSREPGMLLEMPVEGEKFRPVRLSLSMDTGGENTSSEQVQHENGEVLELVSRLLPELLFAPQLGQEGNPGPQRLLWNLGISGDDPLAVSPLPREKNQCLCLIQTWRLLRSGGVPFDLAFLGDDEWSEQFQRWTEELDLPLGGHQGVHFVVEQPENRALLLGMACARLDCLPERQTVFDINGEIPGLPISAPFYPKLEWREDRLIVRGGLPPVRWSIPLTNGNFGYLAMDTGGGYLWSQNARLFRITPWENDPWGQEGPEKLTILTENGAHSLFAQRDGIDCVRTFGPGFLCWEKTFGDGFRTRVTAFVPLDRNERILIVEVWNPPVGARLLWSLEPQMGEYVTQGLWAVAEASEDKIWLKNPVTQRSGICLTASAPWDELRLPQNRQREITLGFSKLDSLVLQIGEPCERLNHVQAKELLEDTVEAWRQRCGGLRVNTPDSALNHYLSFWGQYQVQASRMLARTSVFQCGGAYGFRDQLQDCCALIRTNPSLVRAHILRCCRHQFLGGDVLHWWHEDPGGGADAGVRTRISDDLLWLPYTLSVWWEETGRTDLLELLVPYLAGRRLDSEEHDRYFAPEQSKESESVYRHGIRAVECALGRGVGQHGLCKMGCGDWNDGMDRVGAAGKGESVWLTWFAGLTLRRFSMVCEAMGDPQRACRYRDTADSLVRAAEQCWDGDWFLRGYFDSGVALGSKYSSECRIDSISQSFAALVSADREKVRRGLTWADAMLIDPQSGTVALLSPPFDGKGPNPGYISDYRPGNRENGGQYTHAAVWLALAWFRMGDPDRGWQVLKTLLPEHHPLETYQGEPFVLAADVCRQTGKEGTAGWTWYTGAAGWYWQVAVQELLGIRFRAGRLYLEPQLPEGWQEFQASLQLERGTLEIQVVLGQKDRLLLDEKPISQGIVCENLTGSHSLRLEILRKRGCATDENHV